MVCFMCVPLKNDKLIKMHGHCWLSFFPLGERVGDLSYSLIAVFTGGFDGDGVQANLMIFSKSSQNLLDNFSVTENPLKSPHIPGVSSSLCLHLIKIANSPSSKNNFPFISKNCIPSSCIPQYNSLGIYQ